MSGRLRIEIKIMSKFIKCEECNGTGEVERTIGGEGCSESDVPVNCYFCDGTGMIEDDSDDLVNEHYQDHPDYLKAELSKVSHNNH